VSVPGYGVVTLYGVAPPELSVSITGSGQLNLFWPPTANGYVLQCTTNLSDSFAWTTLGSGQIITNGFTNGLVSVTVAENTWPTFYRLMQP
jgi:hypothetical protein